tara:strand:- start:147 stop:1148 length:1002 start_codon:yes stop_codon:yes gene_type:complete
MININTSKVTAEVTIDDLDNGIPRLVWITGGEQKLLQDIDAARGHPDPYGQTGPDGRPSAFGTGALEAAAIIAQTLAFIKNWKNAYDTAKANEENAAETITRASEDINLSVRDLVDKYNMTMAEAARYQEKLGGLQDIAETTGYSVGEIVKSMMDTGPLDAKAKEYGDYLKGGLTETFGAGGVIPEGYAGSGDQFATAISSAMGLEKTAAEGEAAATGTLLAGAAEDVRLGEIGTSARAGAAEGDTLTSAMAELTKSDEIAATERKAKIARESGFEKARIEDRYKLLAPRVIGPDIPAIPGWLSGKATKAPVTIKAPTGPGSGEGWTDHRISP